MGLPDHLTCLLRNLSAGQEATVRTGCGAMDWFKVGKGVHQGCILSPCLFTLYAEHIMPNAGLDGSQAGIKTAGRNINNLRYAHDSTLVAESEEELKRFFFFLVFNILLKYSWFTMLCQFLLYSTVIQLYIHPFFFTFFSIMVYHKTLNIVLYSRTLLFIHFLYNSLHLLIPNSQSFPPPTPSHPWQPQVCSLFLF